MKPEDTPLTQELGTSQSAAGPLGAWAYWPPRPRVGQVGGPLSGLTFSVKDLYGVEGWPLSASTRAPLPQVQPSPLVTRLLGLGAMLVGKTHLHEIALGITGANDVALARNPLDTQRMPGGSSSGAAITVATGEVDFALGTDTGGSIRVPSAWCGVVGYKPTKGHPAWPTAGVLPLSPTCDHAGPLARDLPLIAQLHQALTQETVSPKSWRGLRVGLWQPDAWLQPSALTSLQAAAQSISALGAEVERIDVAAALYAACGGDYLDIYSTIVQAEAAQVHQQALSGEPTGFGTGSLALLRRGQQYSCEQLEAAYVQRIAAQGALGRFFERYDVLLAPTVAGSAPLLGATSLSLADKHGNTTEVPLRQAVLRLTVPFSLTGVPVLALPYLGADGLSTGIQLVMQARQDTQLLGLGLGLQQGTGE